MNTALAASSDSPTLPLAPTSELADDWLSLSCLGGGVPPAVQWELDAAASNYADDEVAEAHLHRAYALLPDHAAVHIALYRFYFYKNRLRPALGVARRCLSKAARDNGFSEDWQQVRPGDACFDDYAAILPRFYLFTLKACAYLHMRLGEFAEGEAFLNKLMELDPANRLGGAVLRGVLDRMGRDEDDDE